MPGLKKLKKDIHGVEQNFYNRRKEIDIFKKKIADVDKVIEEKPSMAEVATVLDTAVQVHLMLCDKHLEHFFQSSTFCVIPHSFCQK
jgi:hypothetical protein